MPLSGLFWLWDGVVASAYCVLMGCSSCPPGGELRPLGISRHASVVWQSYANPAWQIICTRSQGVRKLCGEKERGPAGKLTPTHDWVGALAWSHLPVVSSDLAGLLERVYRAMCRTHAGSRGSSFSRCESSFGGNAR